MISFVVPAYNEEKYLAATLESIHAAAREVSEPYEIVVADDASTDATPRIAEQGGARVVRVEKRQISATRNAGARAGTGNRLFFVDADTRIDAAVLRAALEAMRAGAIGGGAAVRWESAPRWAHVGVALLGRFFRLVRWAAGCFVFCTRQGFDLTGGFSEDLFAGEEILFSQALKRHGRFVIVPGAVVSSARKMDGHTLWSMLWFTVKLLARNPFGVRRRANADFWYDGKR